MSSITPPAVPPPVLSTVIPAYNEEEALPALFARLRPVLDELGEPYEVIIVDDGSRDRTAAVVEQAAEEWPALRLVQLTRNAGHQMAITAGMDRARGDWVATLDADLQDPPELLAAMLHEGRSNQLDVVYARRTDRRSDTRFKRMTAAAYYRLMARLTRVALPDQVGDYRLLSRRAVDELSLLPERHRVYRLLIPWLGLPSGIVEYTRDARTAGESKYPVTRMLLLATTSVTSFSTAPLRMSTTLGIASALVSLTLTVLATIAWVSGVTVPGWASVVVGMTFLGAVQLICVGVLGEYVGRIYEEVQRRPMYSVARDTLESPRARGARVDGEPAPTDVA